jgi:peptide/nickel transport system permease protein
VLRFALRRAAEAVTTVAIAASLAFLLSRISGNPTLNILGTGATHAEVVAENQRLGLNNGLLVQYGIFLKDLVTGDLGRSLEYSQSNLSLICRRLGASLELAVTALALALLAGIPIGVVCAWCRDGLIDRVLSALVVLGQAIPPFFLGTLLVGLFAVRLRWLPAGETTSLRGLILPAVTLATFPLARIARLIRSGMLVALGEDYTAAARSRGVSEFSVLLKHCLKNAAIPVLTMLGLQAGFLLSGAVTVEVVFAWPGLGLLAVNAVLFRDFPLVQAIVVVGAVTFVIINWVVDMCYAKLDPRVADLRARV